MKRQTSINSQHDVLRGEAATCIEGQQANLEAKWLYLGRWRN